MGHPEGNGGLRVFDSHVSEARHGAPGSLFELTNGEYRGKSNRGSLWLRSGQALRLTTPATKTCLLTPASQDRWLGTPSAGDPELPPPN